MLEVPGGLTEKGNEIPSIWISSSNEVSFELISSELLELNKRFFTSFQINRESKIDKRIS